MKARCMGRLVVAAALAVLSGSGGAAPSCAVTSGPQRIALVELYTSEGCSSCPPADKQLSLIGAPANGNVVALALHVNFWDYIGWKDPFARAEYTDRQRWLIGVNGSRTLYTPHFFVGGVEVQDRAQVGSRIRAQSTRAAGASLRIEAMPGSDGALEVSISAGDAPGAANLALYAAITENALVSRVAAGENRGATLPHDHVVRQLFGPVPLKAGAASLNRMVQLSPEQVKKGVNVVAFVQDTRSGEVLQAASTGSCRAG